MGRRLIMLGGWTAIYEKAKACGFDLTLVQRRQAIKPRDLELADQLITSPLNDKGVLAIVEAIHRIDPFDTVVSFQELGLLNAALICDKLGIAGNPLQPVLLTRDKALMREHLERAGIPSIPHALVSSADDIVAFGNRVGWPIIVKPANGVGSLHIHQLFSADEAGAVIEATLADPITARLIKNDFPELRLIAEKFVEGPEVSVEAISWEGRHTVLAVTDKLHAGYPTFVETGHTIPSALPEDTVAALAALTTEFLTSIGHRHGPSHTEIIVSAQGPVIVESHTRTGGDNIFEMVELACGVDMFAATLQGFAGRFPELAPARGGAAIRYLDLPPGRVAAVAGLEQARELPGVIRCEFDKKTGDTINPVRYSDDRAGYVLATGADAAGAVASAAQALAAVRIEVEADDA